MASAVMALKLKCGSTLASISWTSFARLPAWISLSLVMSSTTSRVTVFTSWSGAASCAGAGTASTSAAAASAALARLLILVRVIVRFLLPWRSPIVDEAAAALQIRVALENVLVERRFLEDAARVEQIGARLGQAQADQPVLQMIGPHLGQRV